MARVYNPTRLMLDANTMATIGNARAEREDSRNRMIASGIAGILRGGQEAIERGNRRAMFEGEEWENPSDWGDKDYQVAKETFINTGDVSALNAYRQRKLQEREQKMREDELATRKKLAEVENRRGTEEAGKVHEEAVDDAMYELETASITANSATASEDEKRIARIKMNRALKTLKKLGVEVEDVQKESVEKKPSGKTDVSVSDEVKVEEPTKTELGKVMEKESVDAKINALEKRMINGFETIKEWEDFNKLVDDVSEATPENQRTAKFNELIKKAKDPRLAKEYREKKESKRKQGLIAKYNNASPKERYLWAIDDPKGFEEAKKLAEGKR